MRKRELSYTKAIVIVHGKCELMMCHYITNNLRLTMEILSDKKGTSSVQINSLHRFIEKKGLGNFEAFIRRYDDAGQIEKEEHSSKKLKNFKIFTIMDTDDCMESQATAYKDKSMFKKYWFYDYIVPIYDSPDLESVLKKCGLLPNVKIKDQDKVRLYAKMFPIDRSYKKSDAIQLADLAERLKKDKHTNLEKFITYCLTCKGNR
ncbi:MAG: hypothetical protein FWE07_05705 [Turicibacter sp.]|nr:hypothetical protein [Turicibacter sp.]